MVLPGMLRDLVEDGGDLVVTIPAGTRPLSEVLEEAFAPWPILASRVRDEQGRIRQHVNVFVDGEDAKRGRGLDTPVGQSSVVHLVNAVSGG